MVNSDPPHIPGKNVGVAKLHRRKFTIAFPVASVGDVLTVVIFNFICLRHQIAQ